MSLRCSCCLLSPCSCGEKRYMEIPTMGEQIASLEQQIQALRNGNTILISALMGMVGQFFYGEDMEGPLTHAFMSAEEQAIEVLMQAASPPRKKARTTSIGTS